MSDRAEFHRPVEPFDPELLRIMTMIKNAVDELRGYAALSGTVKTDEDLDVFNMRYNELRHEIAGILNKYLKSHGDLAVLEILRLGIQMKDRSAFYSHLAFGILDGSYGATGALKAQKKLYGRLDIKTGEMKFLYYDQDKAAIARAARADRAAREETEDHVRKPYPRRSYASATSEHAEAAEAVTLNVEELEREATPVELTPDKPADKPAEPTPDKPADKPASPAQRKAAAWRDVAK